MVTPSPRFRTASGASYTLRVTAQEAVLVRVVDGVEQTDSVALDDVTSVEVVGTSPVTTGSRSVRSIPLFPSTSAAAAAPTPSSASGPDTTWTVSGAGSGTSGTVAFDGVESLVGAPDNQDTFVFTQQGVLAGTIDGGAGGFDTLIADGQWQQVQALATGPDAGSLVLDATTIAYGGLEPITVTGAPNDLVIVLPGDDDVARLTQTGSTLTIAPNGSPTFETHSFGVPANSLTIRGAEGYDKLEVAGTIRLDGANVELDFEEITVSGAVDTRTVFTPGDSRSITLKGREDHHQQRRSPRRQRRRRERLLGRRHHRGR